MADLAAKYLKKGSMIYLEGKIKTRSYDDKTEINATSCVYTNVTSKCRTTDSANINRQKND
jgi:single-strand DNA-binding protein